MYVKAKTCVIFGTKVSPVLFSLFFSDLSQIMTKNHEGLNLFTD